ncbi:MAG: hypothetical protein JJLCMIEE_03325 [Acidimicrobiales bacterium]|nr:MAG: hypothetical protein EDR02_16875 [Actinomycetota bacterium]MBV6510195.1 hypothetical protein [Acidimicrobiales bacterium]
MLLIGSVLAFVPQVSVELVPELRTDTESVRLGPVELAEPAASAQVPEGTAPEGDAEDDSAAQGADTSGEVSSDPGTPVPDAGAVDDAGHTAAGALEEALSEQPGRLEGGSDETAPFTTIGVAVDAVPDEPVLVRVHGPGGWEPWRELQIEPFEGPDPGPEASAGRLTSMPMWVREADGYEVNVPAEAAPAEQVDVLLVRETGNSLEVEIEETEAGAATYGQPNIRSRSSWGARPSKYAYSYASNVKLGIVHHSVTSNSYGCSEVPSILRSIQNYHMDGNGWNDIAYNFAVDLCGGIWEARGGGIDKAVVGGHTTNWNTGTTGVVVLGNFDTVDPSWNSVSAVSQLLGWKLRIHDVVPNTTVNFTDYVGGHHTVNTIIGHRQAQATACPGQYLYNDLPSIRSLARSHFDYLGNPFGHLDYAYDLPGNAIHVRGWVIDPDDETSSVIHTYVWQTDGTHVLEGVTANGYRPDVGSVYGLGNYRGFSYQLDGVKPGVQLVCAYGINHGYGTGNPPIGCQYVWSFGSLTGGNFAGAHRQGGSVTLDVWAIDTDTTQPVHLHVYVYGSSGHTLTDVVADDYRADLAAVFPGYGGYHGYSGAITNLPVGAHTVCVYALNRTGGGSDAGLGCQPI